MSPVFGKEVRSLRNAELAVMHGVVPGAFGLAYPRNSAQEILTLDAGGGTHPRWQHRCQGSCQDIALLLVLRARVWRRKSFRRFLGLRETEAWSCAVPWPDLNQGLSTVSVWRIRQESVEFSLGESSVASCAKTVGWKQALLLDRVPGGRLHLLTRCSHGAHDSIAGLPSQGSGGVEYLPLAASGRLRPRDSGLFSGAAQSSLPPGRHRPPWRGLSRGWPVLRAAHPVGLEVGWTLDPGPCVSSPRRFDVQGTVVVLHTAASRRGQSRSRTWSC